MSAAARGNPYLTVRLPRETHERLHEVAGKGDGGRAGGAALFVRRLIYRELQEPMPAQWGKDDGPLNDMLTALAEIEEYERDGIDEEKALSLYRALLDTVGDDDDIITRNLAFTMIGRLTQLLFITGALELSRAPDKT